MWVEMSVWTHLLNTTQWARWLFVRKIREADNLTFSEPHQFVFLRTEGDLDTLRFCVLEDAPRGWRRPRGGAASSQGAEGNESECWREDG